MAHNDGIDANIAAQVAAVNPVLSSRPQAIDTAGLSEFHYGPDVAILDQSEKITALDKLHFANKQTDLGRGGRG